MHAANRARSVVDVVGELALACEGVVHKRRQRHLDEGHDARASHFEAHERTHGRRQLVEEHAWIAPDEVGAECVLVAAVLVDLDLHGGDGERVREPP